MTDTPALLRSFVAVPLPGAVRTEIAEAARALADVLPSVKWSKKPENLHVTVKFLGPLAAERLDALGAALEGALAEVPRFDCIVRGFGAFPSGGHANVLYAGVDGARARFVALAELVELVASRLGIEREPRDFTAHVTVGRSKEGVDARAALAPWAERAFGAVAVDEVHVYESRLGRTGDAGSTYVLRHRARLNGRSN